MDTSAARQRILARIRSAQQRPAEVTQAERDAAEDYLRRHPEGPRPALPVERVGRFVEQAQALSTTVQALGAMAEVPSAVAAYLRELNLPAQAIAWNTLRDLSWQAAGCQVEFRPPRDADLVGITGCFCAVAETGALVLASGPDTFASAGLLPETHIAIVPVSRIVDAHEDAFNLVRRELGQLPRALNIIAGPSRTGDIEQTIILGAHGPYRVHVLLVNDA